MKSVRPRRLVSLGLFVMFVMGVGTADAQKLAAGQSHTLVVKPDGSVWAVGRNNQGQLGDNSTTDRITPVHVPGLSNIVAVAAGEQHSMALASNGTLYLWGDNFRGEIGDDTSIDRLVPVVSSLTNVVAIAAGGEHSVALLGNGEAWAWGYAGLGQLGTGSTTSADTPQLVASGIAAIAAGAYHTVFVKTDGTVLAAGLNSSGQLGDGSWTQQNSPVQVSGISTATAATCGRWFSIFLLADGTLKATGYNTDGELGDSTGTNRSTPVAVSTLTNVVQIAAGAYHTLAKKSNGSLWAWGLNGTDQLGGGGHNSESAPIAISPPSVVDQIGSGPGALHSLAATATGVLYAWGDNAYGKLGDGTSIARSVPTAVTGADGAWNVGTPTLSVASGTYSVEKTVTVSVTTPDATIHYTQNGSEPTDSDPTVASGGTVDVTSSQTLTAKAFKSGSPSSNAVAAVYTLSVAIPSITPNGGSFTSAPSVSMATTSPGVTLRYTLDGSTPTPSSSAYASAITIGTTTTVKVIGFRSGWTTSAEKSAAFTMNFGTLSAPTASPGTGSYTGTANVSLSSIAGATIRYTTNGAPVSTSSPIYSSPIPISATTTVKAKAYHPDYATSPEASWTYTLTTATPTFDLASGAYAPGAAVTITHPDATAVMRMTIDGADPTTTSQTVTSGTTILLGDFTLKVRAWRTGAADSAVGSGTYTLTSALGPGQITAGDAHTVLVTPEGLVYSWGLNTSNQLGDGTATQRTTPTLVPTLTGVVSVSAGATHTLALTYDGHVFAWGNNGSGRLGDGTTTNRSKPTLITALSNIVAISAGGSHSLALDASGQAYAWGLGTSGQLGNGASLSSSTPVAVSLTNVSAIAAGGTHSLAVTASGTVYSWGANASSQLGDGGTTSRNTPGQITGLTEFASVAAGTAHSLARRQNGELFVWGSGANGRLGLGSTSNQTTPALLSGSQEALIAAGGTHSVALKATGALRGWGANGSGQVGDSSLTQRTAPVAVSGSFNVSALAAGALHTASVDGGGVVRMWGEAGSHQLGTGSTTDQQSPVVIWTAPGRWAAPPPTISLAPGTYTTDQVAIVTDAVSGTVIRYTTNGADPMDTDTQVPANGEVAITRSMTFKVRAFLSDRRPSAVSSAAYVLKPVSPTIAPAAGLYTAAQSVTLSSSETNVTIRYTLDGSDPSASSTTYSAAFSVASGLTVKAKAFRADGTISDASSATYTFNYGIAAAPAASPTAGAFADAQTIALSSALAGSTIRYTTNGSDPTAVSNVYVNPIAISSGTVVVKARVFHQDYTMSAALSQSYTIDTVAPTITAQRFPGPINTWHLTPVTVSFTCADNVGIATCSSPETVSTEGAGQTVTGTAVDVVGRQTERVETLNLDFTPPDLTLSSPVTGLVTTALTVQLTGQVADALSGLVAVSCNGTAATVVDGEVSCSVPLNPGRNDIALTARDAAGNSTSAAVTVMRVGTATHVTLSPATRSMLVDEDANLSLLDDFGATIAGATWSSTNNSIVSLSTDDPPVLTAVATGQAVITATKNGLTSTSTITVVAGTTMADGSTRLPDGTTRWNVSTTPVSNWRRDRPVFTHRIDASGPDVFTVDTNVATRERTVRAISGNGAELWMSVVTAEPLMGDVFGGLVGGVEPQNYCRAVFGEFEFCYKALIRFGGPAGTATWRYDSAGYVDRPAQGPDGTIYAVEHFQAVGVNNKSIVILDGATGQVTARVPVENGAERVTVGPIVGGDGFGYLLVSKPGLALLRLSSTGEVASDVLESCTDCQDMIAKQLLPDGVGGLLIVAQHQHLNGELPDVRVTRLDSEGARVDTQVPYDTRIEMIGQGGTAYLRTADGLEAVDVHTSLAPLWSAPPEWNLVLATRGGGATAQNAAGEFVSFNEIGEMSEPTQLEIASPVPEFESLVGDSPYGLTAVASGCDDGTEWDATFVSDGVDSEEPRGHGDPNGRQAARVPTIVNFVQPENLAIDLTGPVPAYFPSDYKRDFEGDVIAGRLRALPRFFNEAAATWPNFQREVNVQGVAVAFIGHSVLHPDPALGSVGLIFSGPLSIVKTMSPAVEGPGGLPFTKDVLQIKTSAKVIFIAACATGPIFKSLWDIDLNTSNRSLILPIGDHEETNLYWAAQAWRVIAKSLADGNTTASAVFEGNSYLERNARSLRFQVVGGQNVRLR